MTRRLDPALWALLVVSCTKPAPVISEDHRFLVWANYISEEARNSAKPADAAPRFNESDRLRSQWHLSDADLARILLEAQEKNWQENSNCKRPNEPIWQHSLILPPESTRPIEGKLTPETCERGLQGFVIIGSVIQEDGTALPTKVLKSPDPLLDALAWEAVEESRWFPALLCGRPVAVHYSIAVPFRRSSCKDT